MNKSLQQLLKQLSCLGIAKAKIKLLKYIYKHSVVSYAEICKDMRMSEALLSYHINGNNHTPIGLINLGLVEKKYLYNNNVLHLKLTSLGKLFVDEVLT